MEISAEKIKKYDNIVVYRRSTIGCLELPDDAYLRVKPYWRIFRFNVLRDVFKSSAL